MTIQGFPAANYNVVPVTALEPVAVFLHHFCPGSNVPLLPAPLKYHVVPEHRDMGGSVNHLFLRTPAQSSVHFFASALSLLQPSIMFIMLEHVSADIHWMPPLLTKF